MSLRMFSGDTRRMIAFEDQTLKATFGGVRHDLGLVCVIQPSEASRDWPKTVLNGEINILLIVDRFLTQMSRLLAAENRIHSSCPSWLLTRFFCSNELNSVLWDVWFCLFFFLLQLRFVFAEASPPPTLNLPLFLSSLSLPLPFSLPFLSLSPLPPSPVYWLCLLPEQPLPRQRAAGEAAELQLPPAFPAHIAAGLSGNRPPLPPLLPPSLHPLHRKETKLVISGRRCVRVPSVERTLETDVATMQQRGHRGELSSSSRAVFLCVVREFSSLSR